MLPEMLTDQVKIEGQIELSPVYKILLLSSVVDPDLELRGGGGGGGVS